VRFQLKLAIKIISKTVRDRVKVADGDSGQFNRLAIHTECDAVCHG